MICRQQRAESRLLLSDRHASSLYAPDCLDLRRSADTTDVIDALTEGGKFEVSAVSDVHIESQMLWQSHSRRACSQHAGGWHHTGR